MIDPNVFNRAYQPFDPNQSVQNAYALHLLQQRGQMNDLALQQERMRLADMQNQQADQQSIRNAMAQAYQPQTANVQMPSVDVGGVNLPGSTTQVQGPRTLDRQKFLNALRPDLAAREQSAMAVQDTAQQKANVDLASSIAKLNGQQLDNAIKQTNQFRQGLGAVLSADPSLRPALYESLAKQWNHPFNGYPGDDAVKQEADQALTWEQRFQQQKYQQDFSYKQGQDKIVNQQKQAQLAETSRHNRVTEGLQAASQNNNANAGADETTPVDPNSGSILAQTGLSLPAFNVLTGNAKSLPRDKATRSKAMKEAQDWANKQGVDVSTMASQYQSLNKVLGANIERMNNTKIMENELEGTIQNLRQVANDKDLGRLNIANVFKIWAGQQVNDDLAQQYAMHLNQLRNELAAYNGATQGRTGNNITVSDMQEADRTIRNGISKGSLNGLEKAVQNSTQKMGGVMQNSVDAANKAVWGLFGVGDRFKSKGQSMSQGKPVYMNGKLIGHTLDGKTMIPVEQ